MISTKFKQAGMLKSLFLFLWIFAACNKGESPSPQPPVGPPDPPATKSEFQNPLLSSGPDPWVFQNDTNYYYTHTVGNRLVLYHTSKMSELDKASVKTVWTPPSSTAYSHNIWAPEIHRVKGKWYMYFAADDGNNVNHRMYAIENEHQDPMSGTWAFKGKIATPSDKWAIDGTILEHQDKLYFLWSGWEGNVDVQQNIYIAEMSDPVTITGERVLISAPEHAWEKVGGPPYVNEGPQVLKNSSGDVFLTYSASGCWTDAYCLGLITLKTGGNPMVASEWVKKSTPVFTTSVTSNAYAPGHNSFFRSRDGKEDWILYHANSAANQGCGDRRNPRMQKFSWNVDGTPEFGTPVKINTNIKKPGGE